MKMNRGAIVLTIVGFIVIAAIGYYFVFLLPQKNVDINGRQGQSTGNEVAQEQQEAENSERVPCEDSNTAFSFYEHAFEDYPVEETAEKPNAALDLKSHPNGMEYRTAITRAYEEGPNFAGHYTVATWGCGTGCQDSVIVDNWTGKILKDVIGTATWAGMDYKKDSRLLVANLGWHLGDRADCDGEFYVDVVKNYFEMSKNKAVLKEVLPMTDEELIASKKPVVRYGGLFRSSTSGDMRFSYYDIEKRVFLNEWKGHPWFYGPVDLTEVDYVYDHSGYVFKITGEKMKDDCDYYGDGRCMETIMTNQIEAVIELKTDVVHYAIPAVLPKDVRKGECIGASIASDRSDARRCSVGHYIYDPCFEVPGEYKAVCPQGDGFVIQLEPPLSSI